MDWINSMGAATIFLCLALLRTSGASNFFKTVDGLISSGPRSVTIIMLVVCFTGMDFSGCSLIMPSLKFVPGRRG